MIIDGYDKLMITFLVAAGLCGNGIVASLSHIFASHYCELFYSNMLEFCIFCI